ncbi:Response regulator protein VraR [Salinivirga cyanobacteriivorans]|uniref:Response regulator protein VraR n=1 Tax=Salinivirga cyanobacteriivorans TaxID=1307839 RepID=A0A0S2I0I5_9BACT|nr:LuxR C-terminal-related transcriptional regulator [Salinivirga cyanobacteriivorans]ALO15516.1 Response regulator protein VraR [Salinivirga cyanobacteriivorans]
MTQNCKILIIEPSDIIRQGLAEILRSISCIEKIDQIESWETFLAQKNEKNYDLVLLNPLGCCRGPRLRPQVLEKFESTILIGIITTIYHRNLHQDYQDVIYLSDMEAEVRSLVVRYLTQKTEKPPVYQLLSEREIDVLKQMALGLSNKEIAETLHISTHTVISHRKNISNKLGIRTTSGMAIYAVTAKLIDASDILNDIPKNRD